MWGKIITFRLRMIWKDIPDDKLYLILPFIHIIENYPDIILLILRELLGEVEFQRMLLRMKCMKEITVEVPVKQLLSVSER